MRFARFLSIAFLSAAIVAGCSAASAGWTYVPAPSLTPPPSGAASAEPSGPASAEPSGPASAEPSGPASAEPSGAVASSNPNVVAISAFNIQYEEAAVTAPAGKPFQIQFENKDARTPHNVAIHEGSATGTEVFKGEVFDGVATKTYEVPAIAAGQYTFVCTIHPSMTGTFNVQ